MLNLLHQEMSKAHAHDPESFNIGGYMKSKLFFLVIITIGTAVAFNPPEPPKSQRMMDKLNLTDTQKEQFQKISFDTQKKQIETRAKLESSRLDLRRLMTSDALDKGAIEKKLAEIASIETSLKMNHLNGWMEKNKILNADQQKIWKKGLTMMAKMPRPRHMRGMGYLPRPDMQPGMRMGARRMMRQQQMPQGPVK